MKKFPNEIKIAIIAILAIAIIYIGIMFLKGLRLFNNDDTYYVKMDDVSGINIASNVLAKGMKVGSVKDIKFNEKTQVMIVELSITPDFALPEGSSIFITTEMLGSAHVNLALGPSDAPLLHPGDTISGEPAQQLMKEAAGMIPQIEMLLPKLDSILASLNILMADPALAASLHNIEYMTGNLRTTTDNLNTLTGRDLPRMLNHADAMIVNLDTLSSTLARIDIDGIANNANQTLAHTNSITSKLDNAMQSKDNSLGMLLNDNSLVVHIDTTVVNASLLLKDLREHPKRYVHFSLFGKKDK